MLCLSWEGGKKSDNRIVTVDKIQVGLMPERGILTLCLSWEGGKKSDNRIVTVDKIQVGFMPERGIIDAVFILGRWQEE